MFYEIWKTWSLVLDEETDQLYELNKQQEDEIKELKTRLQAKENTSSDFIYFERSRSQKIPDSSLFTDEKNSTWKNWYEKIQNKLEINVDLVMILAFVYSSTSLRLISFYSSLARIWFRNDVIESLHHMCKTSTQSSLAQSWEIHI